MIGHVGRELRVTVVFASALPTSKTFFDDMSFAVFFKFLERFESPWASATLERQRLLSQVSGPVTVHFTLEPKLLGADLAAVQHLKNINKTFEFL